jgi:hypothetical protein
MKKIDIQGDAKLEDVLQEAKKEDVVLMRNGHAVALLTDFDDEEMYARERDPDFIASIVRAREQAAKGETVTHEDLKRELGID